MALNIDESDEESEDGEGDDDEEEEDDDLSINEDCHDEIDEEDEEEESENEEAGEKGIPSQKSWGRKKAAFYDADIVEEYAGSDEDMDKLAEEEEEEALALQKHMAASLEEQDFDAADFELPESAHRKDKDNELDKEKIVQDLSKLSKAEKIQILIKDSPELLKLMDEFKFKLKEVIEKLHPLVKMARAGQVPKEGADYLELKHQLYLNYCVNIGFYLLLKARHTSVRDHPVIERLVQYKKLITELEPLEEKLKPEIEVLLSRGQITSEQNALQEKSNPSGHHNKKRSKKLSQRTGKLSSLLGDDESDAEDSEDKTSDGGTRKTEKEGKVKKSKTDKKRKRKVQVEGKADAMDPLEYYEAVKLQKKKKKEVKEATFSFAEQRVADEEETGDGKRGITYEISQNKGLTAKKKKELRNPRVKHRRKFYKAQIKRKSQVLPVVNEQNRYGGEMTGIRSNLTRSIKIK